MPPAEQTPEQPSVRAPRLGILSDEVAPALADAITFATECGLGHLELRTVDGRNVIDCDHRRLLAMRRQVEQAGLHVSCFASPVFKCALDAGRSVAVGDTFHVAPATVADHFDMLTRAFDVAVALGTGRIRIFSFWREQEPALYTDEIVQHLRRAAEMAARADVLLLLENEPSCNGGYAREVAQLAEMVGAPSLRVLWDPGNEAYGQRSAFPEGYQAVRAWVDHVHLKDVRVGSDGAPVCVPVGHGQVPLRAQLQALQADGYGGLYTIETHFVPIGGTARDGSRQSVQGVLDLGVL